MNGRLLIVIAMILLLLVVSCAPGTNATLSKPNSPSKAAGFFLGVWHGFILLFSLIVSLFVDGVRIYEPYNNGHLYDIGFVLGVMMFFGGSGGGMTCRTRNRKKYDR